MYCDFTRPGILCFSVTIGTIVVYTYGPNFVVPKIKDFLDIRAAGYGLVNENFRRWPHTPITLTTILLSCTMTSPATAAAKAYLANIDLSAYDPEQSRLMQERCILVDENDNAIGAVDKKTCVFVISYALVDS